MKESNKLLRKAMRNRNQLSEKDFHEIVGYCKLELKNAGRIADRKRDPRDNTELEVGLTLEP
jgi:hypothetical protein